MNRALSPLRGFATVQFELQQFKAIKQRLGGTLSDVVRAVAAGAPRHYLIGRLAKLMQDEVALLQQCADAAGAAM